MIYFGIENNIKPEIDKTYVFKHRTANGTFLHIGKCIKNPSKTPSYDWAMEELETGKIYYPYCLDILNLSEPLKSAELVRKNDLYF